MSSESEVTIDSLKAQWNQVLDLLLERDRIAWLAFFDARLVYLEGNRLIISFADATKLSGEHNFRAARSPKFLALLHSAIADVYGIELEVSEE
jgi:hypothetical protein